MKINPFVYGIFVLAVFLGVIFGARSAGLWSTSGKTDASGQTIQPSTSNVESIKGWMTLEQVSTAYNIPVEEILAAFDLPAETPPTTALKDLESPTFDIPTLRAWISARQPAQP